ncbi:MAG: hypothetical protein HWD59_09980 [Coxiellaceae bacterium]|nr:MAG: hypothetical protein HWD59_09980 [Coxiellaceae bacterium]
MIATITNNDLFYRENGQHLTDYDPNEIAANFVPGLYYEKVIRKYEERSSVPGNDLRTDIEYQSDKILANQFKDVKKDGSFS